VKIAMDAARSRPLYAKSPRKQILDLLAHIPPRLYALFSPFGCISLLFAFSRPPSFPRSTRLDRRVALILSHSCVQSKGWPGTTHYSRLLGGGKMGVGRVGGMTSARATLSFRGRLDCFPFPTSGVHSVYLRVPLDDRASLITRLCMSH